MKNYELKKEKLFDLFNEDENLLLRVNNEMNIDDYVYSMDEFDEILEGEKPSSIAFKIAYGNFNPNDDFFKFNGYANLESFNYVSTGVYISDIIRNIIEKENDYGFDEIREILEEEEEE